MIGEGRGKSTQLNPNYDYEDSRNSIPMEGFPSSTGSINIGMDGSGPGLHSSPRQRHYSRDSMDPDGKIWFFPGGVHHSIIHVPCPK